MGAKVSDCAFASEYSINQLFREFFSYLGCLWPGLSLAGSLINIRLFHIAIAFTRTYNTLKKAILCGLAGVPRANVVSEWDLASPRLEGTK